MPIVATLAVIALVCLLAVGYFYRGRKQI
jgi:hypothetical protein